MPSYMLSMSADSHFNYPHENDLIYIIILRQPYFGNIEMVAYISFQKCVALTLVLHNYPESVVLESSAKPSLG